MPEVKVATKTALAKPETGVNEFTDFFAPGFPSRLFGTSPFATAREFAEEMNRMMLGTNPIAGSWTPVADIHRANGDLVVSMELPGLRKEDVKVEMTDEALIIEGERVREHKVDNTGYHRYERSYGKFYRSIPLPEGVKADQAKAEITDGVLKITVPVIDVKKTVRQLPVQEGPKKIG